MRALWAVVAIDVVLPASLAETGASNAEASAARTTAQVSSLNDDATRLAMLSYAHDKHFEQSQKAFAALKDRVSPPNVWDRLHGLIDQSREMAAKAKARTEVHNQAKVDDLLSASLLEENTVPARLAAAMEGKLEELSQKLSGPIADVRSKLEKRLRKAPTSLLQAKAKTQVLSAAEALTQSQAMAREMIRDNKDAAVAAFQRSMLPYEGDDGFAKGKALIEAAMVQLRADQKKIDDEKKAQKKASPSSFAQLPELDPGSPYAEDDSTAKGTLQKLQDVQSHVEDVERLMKRAAARAGDHTVWINDFDTSLLQTKGDDDSSDDGPETDMERKFRAFKTENAELRVSLAADMARMQKKLDAVPKKYKEDMVPLNIGPESFLELSPSEIHGFATKLQAFQDKLKASSAVFEKAAKGLGGADQLRKA